MKWRIRATSVFQRVKDWLSRNIWFFVTWAGLILFSAFWLLSFLGIFGFLQTYGGFIITLDVTLITIVMILIVLDWIPQRVTIFARRYSSIIMAFLFLVSAAFMFVLGTPVLYDYLSDVPLEIGESLSISISVTVIVSLLVIFKGILSKVELNSYLPYLQIDLHHLVCEKIGKSKQALKKSRWYLGHEQEPGEMLANTKRIETDLEIWIGGFIALLALALYSRVFTLSGFWSTEIENMPTGIFLYAMLTLPLVILGKLRNYRIWRHLWKDYWIFIRNMTCPEDTILDSLEPMRYSMKGRIKIEDSTLLPPFEANRLAERHNLKLSGTKNRDELEYIFWYDYVHRKLNNLNPKVAKKFPAYKKLQNQFNSLGTDYPGDSFISLIRSAQILEIVDIAHRMPAVFNAIADTNAWNSIDDSTRLEIYELAVKELNTMRNLGSAPVPSSIRWLLGLFIFSVSVVPYALTLGLSIILP